MHAIKVSSSDVRRLTAVRERLGTRLALFAGLDDMAPECTLIGGDKLVQAELGRGAEIVPAPRRALTGEERADALAVLRRQIESANSSGAMQDPVAVGA